MFARANRLTRSKDVQRVYKAGSRAATRHFLIGVTPSRQSLPRFAVVISKKAAKKAVERNRTKRLIRQAIQELMVDVTWQARLSKRDWVITVHRAPEGELRLAEVKGELERCFERLPSA